jgi:hypothetical protein
LVRHDCLQTCCGPAFRSHSLEIGDQVAVKQCRESRLPAAPEPLTPALRQAIPTELEGIPVEVRQTGRIEAR